MPGEFRRADTKSVSESKFTVMKLPKQYSFAGTLSAWCSVLDWYDGLLSKAKCYWISVSNLTAWPRYPWWGMNFNLWTIRCWHWVEYSSVRFSKLCSVMEDAPPTAERRVVPQDRTNDSQAQHHLAQILWSRQWLSGSSWGHTSLQFLLLSVFFHQIRPIFHHTENFSLNKSCTCVLCSGSSEGHTLSPSPRFFNSFPQKEEFGSGTRGHSIARVRR